jgi:hypothetical protein
LVAQGPDDQLAGPRPGAGDEQHDQDEGQCGKRRAPPHDSFTLGV